MAKLLLLNGPNLNMLGQREPGIYGHSTLADIEAEVRLRVEDAGHSLEAFQANSEGALVDWVQLHRDANFLIVNAGAYTHTSVALRDAIKLTGIPFIELHISNVHAREPFRHHSYLSDIAVGVVAGLGVKSYELCTGFALDYLSQHAN